MIKADRYFKDNLTKILNEGCWDENPRPKYKDGIPARSKFITQVWEEYDLQTGEYPITTLRPTAVKTGIEEILWIYQDQSNKLEDAHRRGITWWDNWDVRDGTIGYRYGSTVQEFDLMNKLLNNLKSDPFGRRHIINLWQNWDLDDTPGLYPCAYETIWSCRKNGDDIILDLTLVQRSSDYIVAGYINKIQYVALQMMVACHLGCGLGKFCHLVQNLHIYDRHFEAALEIINKDPAPDLFPQLVLRLNMNEQDFFKRKSSDFMQFYQKELITKLKSPLELAI